MTALSRSACPGERHRRPASPARPVPDWAVVHRELRRKGVTLMLLWTEYARALPDGSGAAWFAVE